MANQIYLTLEGKKNKGLFQLDVDSMIMVQLMNISGAGREISGIPFERFGGSIGEIYE